MNFYPFKLDRNKIDGDFFVNCREDRLKTLHDLKNDFVLLFLVNIDTNHTEILISDTYQNDPSLSVHHTHNRLKDDLLPLF